MTSRCGWLLLGIAVGMQCLPGCFPLRARSDGSDGVRQSETAPAGVAIGKRPPPEEPAIAKTTGDSTYPPVLDGSSQPDDIKRDQPPSPTVQPPTPTVVPEPKDLVAHEAHDPPATADTKPAAEPPIKLAPFVLALQCVLDDRHQDALKHLEGYDSETQKFYLRYLPMLTIMARKRVDQLSDSEVAVLNDQLQSLLLTLRPRTELVIERMCYCERFKGYGVYQPLPEGHAFVAPSGDRPGEMVSLYVEVRNVASVQRGDCFETRLSSTIEIRDGRGQLVKAIPFTERAEPQRVRSRLNDYCNALVFPVPALPPGTYQLILQIVDETNPGTRRVAQKAMEFRVSPIGSVSARPQ